METFIVRIWTPSPELTDEISKGDFRGSVEHAGSSDSVQFRTAEDLVRVLKTAIARDHDTRLKGTGRES